MEHFWPRKIRTEVFYQSLVRSEDVIHMQLDRSRKREDNVAPFPSLPESGLSEMNGTAIIDLAPQCQEAVVRSDSYSALALLKIFEKTSLWGRMNELAKAQAQQRKELVLRIEDATNATDEAVYRQLLLQQEKDFGRLCEEIKTYAKTARDGTEAARNLDKFRQCHVAYDIRDCTLEAYEQEYRDITTGFENRASEQSQGILFNVFRRGLAPSIQLELDRKCSFERRNETGAIQALREINSSMTHAHHLAMFTERLVPQGIDDPSRRQREKLRKEEKKLLLSTSTATTNSSRKSGLLPLPSASAYSGTHPTGASRTSRTCTTCGLPAGVVDNGRHREVITTLFDTGADGLYMDVRIARRLFDLGHVLATEKVNRQLIGTTGRSDIQLNVTVMLNFGFGPRLVNQPSSR